ncbi:mastermind-like protein 3 isoform 2-T2 [Anableps anableps]
MGDFASPAVGPNGSICINNSMNPASGSVVPAGAVGIPKHSTVVERLRQRIEGCRRHHTICESRYQQAHSEQLELERRDTVNLYQRTLEQRAKKSVGGGGSKQPQIKQQQQDPDSASTEQRNSTLIALQETVKRKLDSARSPLNGDQNGICDGGSYSPTGKRVLKEGPGGLDSLTCLPKNNNNNNVPPISPLHHQMDIKPILSGPNTSTGNTTNGNGTHTGRASDDLGKNGGSHLQDMKLNNSLDLEDSFSLLKDLKQEPLDDGGGMESSEPQSLSNQNKLFSDINLNDQEWQELIDELANTVPEDDMHDLFNEDFEEKKEAEFSRPANSQTEAPHEATGSTTAGVGAASTASLPPPPQGVPQVPIGSPQVRPSSSGPQFATTANGTPPQQPLQQSPAVAMPSGSPLHNCVARSPQTPTQAQTQAVSRPGNGYMMNPGPVNQMGSGGGPGGTGPGGQPVGPVTPELSPAEQLKAIAQHHAQHNKIMQQKQQQQQQKQAANWSPVGAPTSPYNSGPFNQDKPNSPMMYPPQVFNTPQGPLVAGMTSNNGPKAPMNNYLPHNPMSMMGQQQPNSINQNALSKQQSQQQQQTAAMLSYNNTKPLSHFSGSGVDHMGQRMTPPMAGNSQVKNPMMPPYMGGAGGGGQGPGQTQGPIPGQTAHLGEEHKRILMMKQKVLNQNMPYSTLQPHGQLQQQQHLPRQMGQGQRNPYPQVNQYQGPPQDLASRSQSLQNMRPSRLLQQQHSQQQMVQMNSVQGQGGPVGPQADMGLPYGTQGSNQGALYGLNPSMSQMIHQQQHQNQSVQASMGLPPQHNPAGGPPRQAGAGPGLGGMPGGPGSSGAGGYGPQGMLMNSITQQPLKGPAKAQSQRLQNMLGGGGAGAGMAASGWPPQQQGQGLQAMGGGVGRTTGGAGGDMVGFSSSQGYGMQPGQPPRMAKQHFPGSGQAGQGMDPRVGNPAASMGGPMMGPHMGNQSRTNQPRPMVMNQGINQGMMAQGMSGMGAFGPGPGGPGIGGGGGGGPYGPGGVAVAGQPQGYQRTANQDMSSYGYGGGPSGGGAFGLGDGSGAELDSGDGWMDELFQNQ